MKKLFIAFVFMFMLSEASYSQQARLVQTCGSAGYTYVPFGFQTLTMTPDGIHVQQLELVVEEEVVAEL